MTKHTIIYADDDIDDVFMVSRAFSTHEDIRVIHAENGLKALHVMQEMVGQDVKPCLVILDINMPMMTGKETLVRMKEDARLRDIPVVLFTTSSSDLDKQFARNWNVEFFTKPIHYNDLESIAMTFVDKCNFSINSLIN